jgi:hypothetical protein
LVLKADFVVSDVEHKDDYYKSEDEAIIKKLESTRRS